jgi:CelD/BcsL family acetyltransferase involved in cellulose biosynthesis
MQTSRVHPEEFATMREEWNDLVDRSPNPSVFLRWEWHYSWWEAYHLTCETWILRMDMDGVLVGICPLCIRKIAAIRSLELCSTSDLRPDRMDIIAIPGFENKVYDEMIQYCLKNMQWDRMICKSITSASVLYKASLLNDAPLGALRIPADWCPILSLPESYDSMISRFSKKKRYNINRMIRIACNEKGLRFQTTYHSDTLDVLLRTLMDLHLRRAAHKNISSSIDTHHFRTFINNFSARASSAGLLHIYTLRDCGQPVAIVYGLAFKKTFYYYQSGFNPEWEHFSVGRVLLALTIQNAIKLGCAAFDFLKGDEQYKLQWASQKSREFNLCVHRLTPVGLLLKVRDEIKYFRRARSINRS